jgi:hypothetical protein
VDHEPLNLKFNIKLEKPTMAIIDHRYTHLTPESAEEIRRVYGEIEQLKTNNFMLKMMITALGIISLSLFGILYFAGLASTL